MVEDEIEITHFQNSYTIPRERKKSKKPHHMRKKRNIPHFHSPYGYYKK